MNQYAENAAITNGTYALRAVDHVEPVVPGPGQGNRNLRLVGTCGHVLTVVRDRSQGTDNDRRVYERQVSKRYRCWRCPR